MAKVIVHHHVEDYDRWYPVFIEHGQVRRGYGGTGHAVNRAADDPNNLIVVNDFATIEGARSFMADPSLKEAMVGPALPVNRRCGWRTRWIRRATDLLGLARGRRDRPPVPAHEDSSQGRSAGGRILQGQLNMGVYRLRLGR